MQTERNFLSICISSRAANRKSMQYKPATECLLRFQVCCAITTQHRACSSLAAALFTFQTSSTAAKTTQTASEALAYSTRSVRCRQTIRILTSASLIFNIFSTLALDPPHRRRRLRRKPALARCTVRTGTSVTGLFAAVVGARGCSRSSQH